MSSTGATEISGRSAPRRPGVNASHCRRPASSVAAPGGGGAERRRDLESTRPKPGCSGRALRVVGSGGEARGGGSNRKVGGRGGEKKALGSRVPWGTQPSTPGQGSGTKLRLRVRSALGVSAAGRSGAAGSGWGCRAPQRPPARSRAPLTFARAARTHFRGLRAGARGRAGGTAAGHPGKNATDRCPGLGPALAPRKEIPAEEPPGTARRAGSRPRRSPAIAPSPADAGGARVSGRKRLSHFLRSPHSSAPSAPDQPSLSPAPFPKPTAHAGARKTRNLNGCSVRRLPPRQVSSRSQPAACLPAIPTVSGTLEGSPPALHPVPALWSFPLLERAHLKANF